MIGWVDGRPISRKLLDERLTALREGPLSAALPVPGTSEDRQLARWLTQVILTEALCESTATGLGLRPRERPPLDRLSAVELGSINAAAYNGSPWVRAMFDHVTADVITPPEWRRRPSPGPASLARHLVRHRLFTDRERASEASPADLEPLGPIALDSLPTAIAKALQAHPYDTLVGPIEDGLGWHVAIASPATTPSLPAHSTSAPAPPSAPAPTTPPVPASDLTSRTAPDPASHTTSPSPPGPSTTATRRPTAGMARTGPGLTPDPISDLAAEAISLPPQETAATMTPRAAVEGFMGGSALEEQQSHRMSRASHQDPYLLEAARRQAFARWLDDLRAKKVKLVPGFEHPGDPRQPDNHHKH
ncbi:hypothetical protein E1292_15030 [Nonomuraea deserti]|uniref:[acyl-carrier-protein] S-malonyltransferase n=1 Tax=Nonomuraea deserti TaxID=1848322 RepID=A0A4R4VUP5_9ACTN|nr:hypothetical protein [Nonomuraea deserti]TDD06424.1 hypothetical protein E1292_15030 [Nonomuraea deserti]